MEQSYNGEAFIGLKESLWMKWVHTHIIKGTVFGGWQIQPMIHGTIRAIFNLRELA